MILGHGNPADLLTSLYPCTAPFNSDQLFVISCVVHALLSLCLCACCSYTQHAFPPSFLTSSRPLKFSSNVTSSRKSSLIPLAFSVLLNISFVFTVLRWSTIFYFCSLSVWNSPWKTIDTQYMLVWINGLENHCNKMEKNLNSFCEDLLKRNPSSVVLLRTMRS